MLRWIGAALATAVLAGLMQFVTILDATPASACMCAPVSEAGHVRSAAAVFAGTVVDARRSAEVRFHVTRVYRGDITPAVTVANPHGPHATPDGLEVVSSCDVGLRDGTPWLVYAHERHRGGLVIRACNGTRPLPKHLPAVLGTGYLPTTRPGFHLPKGGGCRRTAENVWECVVDDPVRGPVPWLASAGVGLLLLAVPAWWALRMRRMRA